MAGKTFKKMLVLLMTVSFMAGISNIGALAVSYDLANGSVYVEHDDERDDDYSYQGEDGDRTYVSEDTEDEGRIIIRQETEEKTENTVSIGDNVGSEDERVRIEVDGADIAVNEENGSGISVGDGSYADITVKDTDIELNANGTSGISVGDGSDVDIIISGENTIKAGESEKEGYDNILDEINGSTGTSVNMEGISVGGGAGDYSGTDGSVGSDVTIRAGESDSSLTIEGVGAGIVVRDDSTLTIDGSKPEAGEKEDASDEDDGEEEDEEDFEPVSIEIRDTLNVNSTVSGNGIVNYGETVITNGAKVSISGNKNSSHGSHIGHSNGITSTGGEDGVTISDGAQVDISDVAGDGILVESYEDKKPGELTIDNAKVNISGTGHNGIGADSSNVTIKNGAKVEMDDIGFNGINLGSVKVNGKLLYPYQSLDISGQDTVVSIAGVKNTAINNYSYKTTHIYDGAKVTISGGSPVYNYSNATMIIENAQLLSDGELGFAATRGTSLVEIRNGSKVTFSKVYRYWPDYKDADVRLVVIGGTLELTDIGGAGLTGDYSKKLYDESFAQDTHLVWPTNGTIYGDEKLVNFILPADQAHALFETFGWKDGQAVKYEGKNIDALGGEYSDGYGVDLSKYGDGEMLSVWVPAILLEYYFKDQMPEGTDINDYTEDELRDMLEKIDGTDAIIRGQSINFATLNELFTSGNTRSGRSWYYFGEDGALHRFTANTKLTVERSEDIYGLSAIESEPDPDPTPTPTPTPEPSPKPSDDPEPTPGEEDIPDEDVPTTSPDEPVSDIPDEDVPMAEVPSSGVPQTGDDMVTYICFALSVISAAALIVLSLKGRKNSGRSK